MPAEVICLVEGTYNGMNRYKGEIFRFQGSRNEDALIRVGHVRIVDEDTQRVVDDTGREFISEGTRTEARRRMGSNVIDLNPRRPGRPKGSKDSRPRAPKT